MKFRPFHRLGRSIAKLSRFIDRPWYLPLVAIIAALDMFLFILPVDALLISAAALRPKRWVRTFIMITTGSALGALAMGFVIHSGGDVAAHRIAGDAMNSHAWFRTKKFIDEHGGWALAFVAVGPFPIQPGVILAGLAGMNPWAMFAWTWIGRIPKYALFAWSATHAPNVLSKLVKLRKEVKAKN